MEFSGFKVEKTEKFNKSVINKDVTLYKFIFGQSFTDKDFLEYLALMDKLLNNKDAFFMLVDSTRCKHIPVKAGFMLTRWMRSRKADIPGILLGSSVVLSSSIVANLINKAFKIQKPVSPNFITSKEEKAIEFLNSIK
jgi:hypothetical protein